MDYRINSLMRFGVFGGGLAGTIIGLFALIGTAGIVLPVLLGAAVGVGGLVLFCWGFTRIAGHLMYGHDPSYQQWVKNGDPWFDTLPPPFRASKTNSSRAPYFCLKCGGDMFVPVGVCPACGHGADQMQCPCGTEVTQPYQNAFETTGVTCPNCRNVLRR